MLTLTETRSDDAQSLGARTDAPGDRSALDPSSPISPENNGGAARRVPAHPRRQAVNSSCFISLVLSVPSYLQSPTAALGVSLQCARRPRWQSRTSVTLMILPQVHLRKPCYDFYFL
ncbi:hypothetical protein P5V15_002998 [Pogonomyrmex californicus]